MKTKQNQVKVINDKVWYIPKGCELAIWDFRKPVKIK